MRTTVRIMPTYNKRYTCFFFFDHVIITLLENPYKMWWSPPGTSNIPIHTNHHCSCKSIAHTHTHTQHYKVSRYLYNIIVCTMLRQHNIHLFSTHMFAARKWKQSNGYYWCTSKIVLWFYLFIQFFFLIKIISKISDSNVITS